jgi:cellulose synthase/poly-beta-1,6-N-acetylglucosamine synthase-like glycosyltransferase
MISVFIFIGFAYALLIISFVIGFYKVDLFFSKNLKSKTKFSVIVPFRNEAKNLPNLLNSIAELEYSKELVEFILVDDDSTDDSIRKIEQFLDTISKKNDITKTQIHIVNNKRISNSPKKDAITTAILIAKNQWILTTDADCILPKKWLKTLDNFIQQRNPKMVVAPVNYKAEDTFLQQFQLLDFMSMQATTIGGFGINFPFLSNGANLGYKKEVFFKVNGFEGNHKMASGDDVFLLEKFLEIDKNSVQFLKSREAIVTTLPVMGWKDLINQRTRWAAKTSNFKSIKVKLIGFLVLLTNLSVILYVWLGTAEKMFVPLLLKIMVDLSLFIPIIQFFEHKKTWVKWYLFSSLLYPFFSLYVILLSFTTKYNWKGRTFNK